MGMSKNRPHLPFWLPFLTNENPVEDHREHLKSNGFSQMQMQSQIQKYLLLGGI